MTLARFGPDARGSSCRACPSLTFARSALDLDDVYVALVGREVQKQPLAIGREIEARDAMRIVVPEQEPRSATGTGTDQIDVRAICDCVQ